MKNKVSWLSWSEESFQKATELDKPILLGISAVWCHWCHVMDETTYSNSRIANLIEELFIPIRVDRDQRPDIDKRYNMGGWPSTAFLTPEGEVLTGGTYIPPQQMIFLLENVSQHYKKEKINLKTRINKLKKEMKNSKIKSIFKPKAFQSIIDDLTFKIASQFDSKYGGFGNAPKFPHTEALRLSLLEYQLQGHKAALSIVKKTLTSMRTGGIYDKEEGGFFRYSTTRDWSIPHYEKMCEDNAKLINNYIEAYQVTRQQLFKETAKGIIDYVDQNLCDKKNGGFYGSQDADEVYYKLSLQKRKNKTPPQVDQTVFVNWNAMMVSAYILASIVLEENLYKTFALRTVKMLLKNSFDQEKGMNHFIIDNKSQLPGLLTDQVYMIKCLIDCYQITLDKMFLNKAEKISKIITDGLWDKHGGFYDKPRETNALGALKLLDKPIQENSIATEIFLRLYHFTGKKDYFEKAKKTLNIFVSNYNRYGIMGSIFGLAVEHYLHPMQVHIVGSKEEKLTFKFFNESLKTYYPLKIVDILDPKKDKDRLKQLGYPLTDSTTAYICFEGSCKSVEKLVNISKVIRGKANAK